jgi:di/tricarboxylate transporter
MDEAYKYIEWRAVFLIAGMLPLGAAMEKSGAAALIADSVVDAVGDFGPYAILAAVFVLTSAAAQVMPRAAAAVLMAPIAVSTATALQVSPYTFAMMTALGASTGFMSPVGHPVNIMVMGPGGYRFADYPRVGFLLVVSLLATAMVVVPLVWPL